ncbi:NAD(P)-binding protein [Novosphingobium sp.]|uniref:NAD(P)-binding protein n=1 Tax=Novosphingobium sp. TaxID=1874826 RepID=UPI002B49A955|nr:NAD(P)-binding protein [Novosphingobium sp.]HKR93125.1 NAD(P)-binding protein [Novosphingobium sp.]
MQTKVAIVGGGLAGLYAARLLNAVGVDFRLLEARDRFGGRVPPLMTPASFPMTASTLVHPGSGPACSGPWPR